MQATSLNSLVLLPPPPSCNSLLHSAPRCFVSHKRFNDARSFIHASKNDSFGHGKLVDENMILLRMRIREIEKMEMKSKGPSDWTEWEKKYFENYDSDVCEAVGLLQRLLMNTRPCLAVGSLALLMLSMSMSFSISVFHLVELAKGIM
ncbi:hypothetical protein RJT34_25426 [Clitoria ternatea]|uniref:Uncharacterized protein n=1 Tax=Clitoria ternatea TaxID=43366 RepID=A0AAN9FPR4_CLITE